ncbi:adhesion G-protein coupled receptor G2-like [Aricia agestis]|uniref:adhesion G-protein coupled receptor G2-like n=1 Tax=Aricia agestis TaxID=91739 RepID=UPI001C2038CA|nr:adhesion G-protein coupled receptor G2-like [Aricia agestis]
MVNGILENRHETPEKTLHELDQLSLAWAVNNRAVTVVKDDVAVVVPDKLVRGFWVSSTAGRSEFEKHSFDILHEAPSSRILRSQESEVVVTLPPSALTKRHVSFVIIQNKSLFPSQPNGFIINSLVISVNIENVTHFHGGEVIDIHFRPIATPGRNESRSCAYWHFLENSTGYWSQEGCDFIRATEDGMLDTCRCNHLTHFAAILVPKTVFSEANERALEILTIAGCSLSFMGLIIVGATALLFRSWRQEFRNKIWLQMCMAILILVVTFLVVIFVHYDRYRVKCLLLGVTLHYAVLASFCWMLVAAVLAYRQLTLVFTRDVPHKLLRAAVFAWGAPGVICLVLLSVSPESYAGRFQEMTPGGNFCYPTGLSLWLAVYAPISCILVTNWTLFALILRSVFCSKKIRRYGMGDEALQSVSVSFTLGFLFGLPWVFGLFASNVVAAYLFTLTATFQGFVLFALLVIGNKRTRELWANKMFKKRNKPMTLVTDSDRSADAANRSDRSADAANRNGRGTPAPILLPDTFNGYLEFN